MGKQVTFFMTHEDEKEFLEAVRQFGSIRLMRNFVSIESEKEILSLPVDVTTSDANLSLVNGAVGSEPRYEFFPSSRNHCIDLAESDVVQFSRCKMVNTWLLDGRLWFDEKSSRGKKSAAFLKWANSLLKWVQSNYYKDVAGNFVGPDALKLSEASMLQLGPPITPSISLEERKRILGLQ